MKEIRVWIVMSNAGKCPRWRLMDELKNIFGSAIRFAETSNLMYHTLTLKDLFCGVSEQVIRKGAFTELEVAKKYLGGDPDFIIAEDEKTFKTLGAIHPFYGRGILTENLEKSLRQYKKLKLFKCFSAKWFTTKKSELILRPLTHNYS